MDQRTLLRHVCNTVLWWSIQGTLDLPTFSEGEGPDCGNVPQSPPLVCASSVKIGPVFQFEGPHFLKSDESSLVPRFQNSRRPPSRVGAEATPNPLGGQKDTPNPSCP